MDSGLRAAVGALRRRVALACWFGEWSWHLLVACLVAGSLALLARSILGIEAPEAARLLWLVAMTPATAWWRARGRFLGEEAAAAWLDVRAGATGRVVTELELGDERWRARSEEILRTAPRPPRLRLAPMLARTAAGAAFALLALFVELPRPVVGPSPRMYDAAIEDLREKLETLQEEVELEEETQAELAARLRRLEEEVAGARNPEATFEAMSRLAERMEQEAALAEEAARSASEALARVASAAESADEDASASEERPSESREAFERALSRLSEEGLMRGLPSDLSGELGATVGAPVGTSFDLSELSQLSEALRKALEEKLARLAEAGLLEAGALGRLGELGELASLDDFELHECDESCEEPGGT